MASFTSPQQKIEMLVTKCNERYSTARDAYRYLDESNNGYITPTDVIVVFRRLLQFELSAEEAQDVVDRFAGHEGADRIAYDAFARAYYRLGTPPAPLPPPVGPAPPPANVALSDVERLDAEFGMALEKRVDSLRAAFLAIDTHRTGFISFDELADALTRFGVRVTAEETRALCELYDIADDGKISYAEFVQRAALRDRPYQLHLERQQDDLLAAAAARQQQPPPAEAA